MRHESKSLAVGLCYISLCLNNNFKYKCKIILIIILIKRKLQYNLRKLPKEFLLIKNEKKIFKTTLIIIILTE